MPYPGSIFLTGATGYVGGSLLVSLAHTYPLATIAALVRNPDDSAAVSQVGPNVRVVLGSHTDHELIINEVSESDLVFQVSNLDDLGQESELSTSIPPALQHMRMNQAGMLMESYQIWDDTDKDRLRNAVSIDAPHRIVDLEAIRAHEENVADVYVICPPTIYGVGTGPVRRTSVQIPHAVRIFLEKRCAEYIALGTNTWSNVHINDLSRAFLIIVEHALRVQTNTEKEEQNTKRDGFDNFYFTGAAEHEWGLVLAEVAQVMHRKGLLETPIAKSIPVEYDRILSYYIGTSCRVRSTRLKSLGWEPKEKGIKETVSEDVDASLEMIKSGRKPNF
ncbi:hypothetical protein OPQ81_011788 [Rhizoctonia solani]|nr:hypothetical protein OPQ81_011788 [Rhizoctonia solani]